jgi:hypothetical protein
MLPRKLQASGFLLLAASVRVAFALAGSGASSAAAAQAFGQDDDLTVLTLERKVPA